MRRRNLLGYVKRGLLLTAASLIGGGIGMGTAPPVTAETSAPVLYDDDMVLGRGDAPVTIIEYASLTCPHCAKFSTTTFPKVMSDLIATGKVRWVYRDFPLDRRALLAAQLARCMPKDKYFATIDILFATQDDWVNTADVNRALSQVGRAGGLEQAAIDACLKDDAAMAKISERMKEAAQLYDVRSTPTFIIGGKAYPGAIDFEEVTRLVKSVLPGSS